MGSSGGGKSTTTQVVKSDPWIGQQDFLKHGFNTALDILDVPTNYYQGQTVADFKPSQWQAWNDLANYVNDTNSLNKQATNTLNNYMSSGPSDLVKSGQNYLQDNLSGKYLNPTDNAAYNYLNDVMTGKEANLQNTESYDYFRRAMNGEADNIKDTASYNFLTGAMNGDVNNIRDTPGYGYFTDVIGGKYLPPSDFKDSTYAMDPFSYNPESNPYYDRIVERAMGQANSQAANNGAYGSSDWLNLRGNTAKDLYADQYNQERQWYENQLAQNKGLYEQRYGNERNLMNSAGNSLLGADEFQNNYQLNAGNAVLGADQDQRNFQMNAGQNMMQADQQQYNNQINTGNNLLNFYTTERNNQQQAAGMVPAMDQASYARQMQAMQMAPSINNMNLTNMSAMENIGLQQQQQDQRNIDANMRAWQYNVSEPTNRLNNYMQAIKGDYGGTQVGNSTAPTSSTSPTQGAIGGALSGGMIGGMLAGSQAGGMTGPVGAGVGAAVGGTVGLISSFF